MSVIDVMTYNGERDMLQLHLGALSPHVDTFLIVEAKTTFSGYKKPLYFFRDQRYFKDFWHKIEYYVIDEEYSSDEIHLAETSPNTQGAAHWKREFLQKESIMKALRSINVREHDRLYIGDVDEIWEPVDYPYIKKLKLRVYAYYLDNRSSEEFWGPITCRWGEIAAKCLNHVRSDTHFRSEKIHGWHFTSMGGLKEVQRKLNDSYTPETYNTAEVQLNLPDRHRQGLDYLGRPFQFHLDTSEWPAYLTKHHTKFKHLCFPGSDSND